MTWRGASCDRLAEPVVQEHAIGQTGQVVMLGRMGDLQRHRPGRAHVAEDDHGSGRMPLAVMHGGYGVLDRDFMSVTAHEYAVRRQVDGWSCPPGIPSDSAGLRLMRVQDLQDLGHRPCLALPAATSPSIVPRRALRKVMFPAMSVQSDGIADAVERDVGALVFREQGLFHRLALDRIAQRPQQPRASISPLTR